MTEFMQRRCIKTFSIFELSSQRKNDFVQGRNIVGLILFDFFDEGVFIYEQIRNIELENHGQEVLNKVDSDIASGKIELYSDQKLKDLQIYKIFEYNFSENTCMVLVIWVKYMRYH